MLWGSDQLSLGMPLQFSARRALARGQWPLWMPELFCGMPGLASMNNFLYPSFLLYALAGVPVPFIFGYDAFLQVVLSGLGTYLFCRRLGLRGGASLVSGLAFACSGTQVSLLFAGHTNNVIAIALIPWTFFGIQLAFSSARAWRWYGGFGLTGAALALQILGVGMQIFAYDILALAAFTAWLAWREGMLGRAAAPVGPWHRRPWARLALGLGLMALLCTLLSAPQLLPTLRYLGYSLRHDFSFKDFGSWSFPPAESLQWIVPGFFGWASPTYCGRWEFNLTSEYMGLVPWALAFAALAAGFRQKRGPHRFFAGLALASFVIALGHDTPLSRVFFHLPVYSGFRSWTRFLCLLTFSVCVLAGLGLDALLDPREGARARRGALAFCGLALLASAFCLAGAQAWAAAAAPKAAPALGGLEQARRAVQALASSSALRALGTALALGAGFFLLPRLPRKPLAAALALAGLVAFHLWDVSQMHARFITFADPDQVLARPAFLKDLPDPQAPQPTRFLDPAGLFHINQWADFGMESIQGYHGMSMQSAESLREAMKGHVRRELRLLNVRYILERQPLNAPGLKLVGQDGGFVYENEDALPRAFLAGRVLSAGDPDQAYAMLARPDFDPGRDVILVHPSGFAAVPGAKGGVEWLSRGSDSFDLRVTAGQNAYLVVSQSWYPGWKAWVDGRETPVLQADGALQAIALPAGGHRVRFAFESAPFQAGLGLAGLGLLLALGLAWKAWRESPETA